MSLLKTKITEEEVLVYLKNYFNKPINRLQFIKGGEMSQAFSFQVNGLNYVIRVNRDDNSYAKDKYAYEHFQSSKIPMPEILDVGKFNEVLFFALSEVVKGKNLDEYNESTVRKFIPEMITILDDIHEISIEESGYGYWDIDGKASIDSWKKFIVDNEYLTKTLTNPNALLEKDVVKRLTDNIVLLSEVLPEDKYLVHGDFGFSNLMSDGEVITGVLDWGESLYGDFIYDVAWLDFWSDIEFRDIFKKYYLKTGRNIDNFERRLLCYKLKFGLGSLNFFSESQQKESYIWTRDRLLDLIKST